jgi:hypothetical protein
LARTAASNLTNVSLWLKLLRTVISPSIATHYLSFRAASS